MEPFGLNIFQRKIFGINYFVAAIIVSLIMVFIQAILGLTKIVIGMKSDGLLFLYS